MSYRVLKLALIAMCVLAAQSGVAGEPLDKAQLDKLRTAMEAPGAGLKVLSAQASDIPGLYEVELADGPMVYATLEGDFFIVGDLYSVTPDGYVNLAEKRRDGERMAKLATVKMEDMIVFSPEGETRAHVSVFFDDTCYYCQKLHQEVGDDRVGLGRVAAGDDEGVEVLHLGDGVGHGAAADGQLQAGDGAGGAEAGAVVDVVGGEQGTDLFDVMRHFRKLGEVVADRGIASGQRSQRCFPVWIWQAAGIEDEIGVGRHAALVCEGFEQQRQAGAQGAEFGCKGATQLVHIEVGGIDDFVGDRHQRAQQFAFEGDGVIQCEAVMCERMTATRVREALQQHIVARVQKNQLVGEALVGDA